MTGYAIKHAGRVFTPDGKAEISDVEKHNRELEAQELAQWATAPERWQGYVCGNELRTWTGKKLGDIVSSTSWRERKWVRGYIEHYMMRAIRVRGINGAIYYGRYGSDWSQLCRIRKAKAV